MLSNLKLIVQLEKEKKCTKPSVFGGVQFQLAQCIAKCFSLKKGVELENDRKDIVSGNER